MLRRLFARLSRGWSQPIDTRPIPRTANVYYDADAVHVARQVVSSESMHGPTDVLTFDRAAVDRDSMKPEEIGRAIVDILQTPGEELPPDRFDAAVAAGLAAMGGGWERVDKHLRLIMVFLDESGVVQIVPWKWHAGGGHFSEVGDPKDQCPLDPNDVGAAVVRFIKDDP